MGPSAPLSPGPNPPDQRSGGSFHEARRPALAGPRKEDARPPDVVHIRGAGFCGSFSAAPKSLVRAPAAHH